MTCSRPQRNVHWPGFEPGSPWSEIRRPNHCATPPPPKQYILFKFVCATDKQNALRRECTFKIEIVLEIGVAGVNIYLKITVLTLTDVLARLAQSVRPWRMVIDFYQ